MDAILDKLKELIGLPVGPKSGIRKFQYLDTRYRGTVSVSGLHVSEGFSAQLGESIMCGTKFLIPNPFSPSKAALPPNIIATPLSYLLNFGGVNTTVASSLGGTSSIFGKNYLLGDTIIGGNLNVVGVVTINGKNLEAELALGKSLPSSDERLKKNIHTITNPIEKVTALRGVTFEYKESGQKQIGFIAQEVEKIIPELVGENPDGYKGVQYQNVVGLLVEAIKEQQKQIDELKRQING